MTRNPLRTLVMAAIVGAVAVSFACSTSGPMDPTPATPGTPQTAPAGQYVLTGTVLDDRDMAPLAGVEIEATSGAGVSNTVTASDGTFSLLVAGEVTLRAHRPGYRRAELTLRVVDDMSVGVHLSRQRLDPDR